MYAMRLPKPPRPIKPDAIAVPLSATARACTDARELAVELLLVLVRIGLDVHARPLLELPQDEGGRAAALDDGVAEDRRRAP